MSLQAIPLLLVRLRLALGPVVLVLALMHAWGALIAFLMIAATLSDVFDGVLARRWGISTESLRVADSRTDAVYNLSTVAALFCIYPQVFAANRIGFLFVGCLEAATNVFDRIKYGRPCSHHAYSAKAWAASYCVFATALLGFGRAQPYAAICIFLGVVNNVEGIIMRTIMLRWVHDVSGIPAALCIRRRQLASGAGVSLSD